MYTRKDLEELFAVAIEELNKYKVNYIPMFGTLLGVIRDDGIIAWDEDIDIAIVAPKDDILKIAKNVASHFEGKYELVIGKNNYIQLHSEGKEKIDFIPYLEEDGVYKTLNDYGERGYLGIDDLSNTQVKEVYGAKVSIPVNYEAILKRLYNNWEQPMEDSVNAEFNKE